MYAVVQLFILNHNNKKHLAAISVLGKQTIIYRQDNDPI